MEPQSRGTEWIEVFGRFSRARGSLPHHYPQRRDPHRYRIPARGEVFARRRCGFAPGLQQRSKRLGAFVRYTASGTLTYSQGFPNTATYQQLNYQIVGYNGAASFTFDPQTRDAILGGPITQLTTLEAGSLIAGQLQFSPTDLSISGSVSTTITEVLPQFVVGPLAGFDFTVSHPPTSYRFLPSSDPSSIASEVQVDAQSGTTGSLRSGQGSTVGVGTVSAAALTAPESPGSVPEPASMKVFGFAAAALALTRRFIGPDLARGDTPRDLMRA